MYPAGTALPERFSGNIGEPTVWWGPEHTSVSSGLVYKGKTYVVQHEGRDFYYTVKEQVGDWWKLEWPD